MPTNDPILGDLDPWERIDRLPDNRPLKSDAGLVGEIENHPTKGLRFALPMTPICKKTALKLCLEAKAQEEVWPEKLPNDAPFDSAEIPMAMRADGQSPPLSIK